MTEISRSKQLENIISSIRTLLDEAEKLIDDLAVESAVRHYDRGLKGQK